LEIKTLAAITANGIGFFKTYGYLRRKLTKSQIAILMYHRVSPAGDNWSINCISPESFERHLVYFSRNYNILSLEELVHNIKNEHSLPRKGVVITFDDGYRDNYVYAYPILKKYNVPATIFLTTGHIGTGNLFWWDKINYAIYHTTADQINLPELGKYRTDSRAARAHAMSSVVKKLKKFPDDRKQLLIGNLLDISGVQISSSLGKELILSWDEIRKMGKGGIVFGSHSVTHAILSNMLPDEAKKQIRQSKEDIEENTGQEVFAFSYPNGDFNAQLVELVRESGFTCAVSVNPGKLISAKDDVFKLSRLGVIEDLTSFNAMSCGFWGDMKSLRGCIK
jgi:peptidoglycan/xylan/chitin deacetylase (PgdA/CDA1 family)